MKVTILRENNKFTPADIYLLKVNNKNTRTRCEICSKLTIKTPERRLFRQTLYRHPGYKNMN